MRVAHRTRRALLLLTLVGAGLASIACPAGASAQYVDGERRPGLTGRYTARPMTIARNSLYIIGGPWAPMLLGQRKRGVGYDGGLAFVQPGFSGSGVDTTGQDLRFNIDAGVGFGLFDNFEAGAAFLSFEITPSFSYGGFPVFLTYFWHLGPVDIGARTVWFTFFETPTGTLDADGNAESQRTTILNPSIPVLVRLGQTVRLDTGVFLPLTFTQTIDGPDVVSGLSVPLRVSWSPLPELVVGAESGFYVQDLANRPDPAMMVQSPGNTQQFVVPLGLFVGGVLLVGKRLFEPGVSFTWDDFWLPDPGAGVDGVQAGVWRINFGLSIRSMVL
jgi:hypothetical protein